MLVIKLESPYKSIAKLRQEVQRASEKSDMPPYRFTACKSRYGLIDDRLKYGCREVLFSRTLIYKRLNV